MDKEINEIVMGERKFLHDISNQLVIAQGMGSFISKRVSEYSEADDKDRERMEKTLNAINKIISMVKERREFLHSFNDAE